MKTQNFEEQVNKLTNQLIKKKNNVVIEVPLNMCVSEMKARYRKLLSIPTSKEVFIDDVSKWAAQIIQSHLTRADMLADNSNNIIKPT